MTRYRVLPGSGEGFVFVDCTPTDDPAAAYEPVPVAPLDRALDDPPPVRPGNLVDAELAWPTDGPAHVTRLTVERRDRYRFADGVETLFEAARETWRDAANAGEAMASRVTHGTDGDPNGALYVFADAGPTDLFAEFRDGRRPLEPLVERVETATDARDADGTGGSGAGTPTGRPTPGTGTTEPADSGSDGVLAGGLTGRLDPAEADSDTDDAGEADETDDAPERRDAGDHADDPRRAVYVLRPAGGAFVTAYVVFDRDGILARTMDDTYF
ncbi:MAG: DUF6663 family protein [Halobaculum sp.]